jgi:hypothetical protein
MTPEQIEGLGPAFANYMQQFDLCCDYPQTFRLLGVYCHGLLSDLERKSAEPIALAFGVAVRTLQEFLPDHCWSLQQARDVLQAAGADASARGNSSGCAVAVPDRAILPEAEPSRTRIASTPGGGIATRDTTHPKSPQAKTNPKHIVAL